MKITLLPSTYYSDPTYHRVLSSLRREFAAAGHEVSVVSKTTSKNPELQLTAKENNRPGGRPPLLSFLAKSTPPGATLNFHFSGWLREWHYPLLMAEALSTARLVVSFQDYRHPDLPAPSPAGGRKLLAILRKARRITAVSHFLERMIRRDFPSIADKLVVIPNGADIPPAEATPPPAGEYILTVGRQAPYKGLDLLLFAFARAVEKGCGKDLIVCGAGERGPLARLARMLGIADRVTFKGLVSPGELSALMKNCLFFATTPRWESFGMAALEAMASGKAVLAARTGGLAEFAGDSGSAFPVAPENPEAVSSAILKLTADGGFRKALGLRAAAVARKYSWKKVAAKYISAAYR